MDQFAAHLERGWDLLERGDFAGAEQSAQRALEVNAQAPEAYNLLGFVEALRGEYDEALSHYQQAMELDDQYLDVILNAAELYLHPLREFESTIALCDQALALTDDTDERLAASLLKFDAYMGMGKPALAAEVAESFPSGPYPSPHHVLLIGRALYEIGDDRARQLITEAARLNPENPEAFYYLGLVKEEAEDTEGAISAYLRARALDLESPAAPWSLSPDSFEHHVRSAINKLPMEISQHLAGLQVYISDLPGAEIIADGLDLRAVILLDAPGVALKYMDELGDGDSEHLPPNTLLGFAEPGKPLRSFSGLKQGTTPRALQDLPPRLFVYQRNLERAAGTVENIEAELISSLTDEVEQLLEEQLGFDLNEPSERQLN